MRTHINRTFLKILFLILIIIVAVLMSDALGSVTELKVQGIEVTQSSHSLEPFEAHQTL